MARDFTIHGECLVKVKGGLHLSGRPVGELAELGLATDQIRIIPKFNHYEVRVDDFGLDCPVEILTQLAEVRINMALIHFDRNVLDICIDEATGGAGIIGGFGTAGKMTSAGQPLGNGRPIFSSGNHYISLNITSQIVGQDWRFRSCYLAEQPMEYSIGSKSSIVVLNWKAIPYVPLFQSGGTNTSKSIIIDGIVYNPQEIRSSGVVLWDRNLDT